ncbi:hypothetical protein SESBI_17297 [Sesbania bispinosa]|nr:hypothetical protein SESBI_17297 [Sesbania bispinosa]
MGVVRTWETRRAELESFRRNLMATAGMNRRKDDEGQRRNNNNTTLFPLLLMMMKGGPCSVSLVVFPIWALLWSTTFCSWVTLFESPLITQV